ncbi:heme utilization protein [Yersinia kristensenii]|uniref:Heme utilization protein n=2 Tax=Yersinia kristensenii TaxID=28152 RepID=A0AB73NV56_YERKR|nr:heme utilization protein [Yersinia kristensenii]
MGLSPLVAYLSTPDYFDSVDVREMGGMYANRIRIIAEGNINNGKHIESTGALQMVTRGNINNSLGGAITGRTVQLYSGGIVHNLHGKIKANISSNTSGVYINAAGLNNDEGRIQTHGGSINIVLDSPIENNNGDISIVGKTKTKQLKI